MARWIILLVVALGVVVLVLVARPKGPPASISGLANPPQPSPALRTYLYTPFATIHIAATDIHDFTEYQNQHGLFGQRGLRYVVDPQVEGMLNAYGHQITWASILDDFCRQNACLWEIADPRTIRIRPRHRPAPAPAPPPVFDSPIP